jgi:hypothetical protein
MKTNLIIILIGSIIIGGIVYIGKYGKTVENQTFTHRLK